ncbi:MAG: PEP-CTERM system TPR-repeat protein PrsT [Gammaproteobacteria bacterium]|nr:PEP-CTERM system TPR-repeat protein PrsT [Gammaproteobacteria bacterium]
MDATTPSSRRGRSLRRKRITRNLGLAALLVVIAGGAALVWDRQHASDPRMLLKRATAAYKAEDYKAATIDLRAALAVDSDNAEARALLGHSFLKQGDANGALRELEKARGMGMETVELAQAVVRAEIMLGKFDQARAELVAHGDDESPDWTALSGMLELGQRNLKQARELFQKVLDKHPQHDDARRGLLQVALQQGDLKAARNEIETLLKSVTKDAGLWMIKGALELEENQLPAARAAFKEALTLAPRSPGAILGMTQVLLAGNEFDAASAQLDAVGPQGAEDPRVSFLRARIAEGRKDFESALLELKKVLLVAPNDRDALVMGARLCFSLGQFSRAEEYASQLLQLEPDNEAARRLLTSIQLAGGRLEGLDHKGDDGKLAVSSQDPGMLALLGTAYLKRGDYADAEKQLNKAAKLAPDSLPIRTQLALGKMSAGRTDEAIKDLRAILTEKPDFLQANVVLVLAELSEKRVDDALTAAQALLAARPDDALAHNVLGFVYESKGDKAQAKAAYQQALAKDANFHPARINLARLAGQDKDVPGARKYFEEVLARDQFNAEALLGLAAAAVNDKNFDEAEKYWLTAREHNVEAVAPRLALARYYRSKGKLPQAEEVVREAYKLASYAPAVQAEYAEVMLGIGDNAEALKAVEALAARAPQSLPALELLARTQNQLGNEKGLGETLQKIVKSVPDHEAAQILLAQLALRHKDADGAERIAKTMIGQSKNAAAGHELLGDIAMQRDNPKAAAEAYARALEIAPDTSKILKLDHAEQMLGINKDRLGAWISAHPDDERARLAQATLLQQQGAADAATAAYERMLETRKQDPVVLNNLAWLYFERKDARALDMAKQAYDLAPRQPQIVDTYAWILFQQGKREQGIELLKKAVELAPSDPDIAFHLVSAMADSGQEARALEQVRQLLDTHKEFSLRKDAEALAARLSK